MPPGGVAEVVLWVDCLHTNWQERTRYVLIGGQRDLTAAAAPCVTVVCEGEE